MYSVPACARFADLHLTFGNLATMYAGVSVGINNYMEVRMHSVENLSCS
jgi:hypothetical protein